MPGDGAIIFSDLIGKLDVLRVTCEKCGRDGCYGLSRLIDKRGCDAKVIDWLDELKADCPKNKEHCAQHERSMRRAVPTIAEGAVAISMSAVTPIADISQNGPGLFHD
jgi:hypothetical protein